MAVWSKALPLTVSCLSPISSPQVQVASHDFNSRNMAEKVTKNKIPNFSGLNVQTVRSNKAITHLQSAIPSKIPHVVELYVYSRGQPMFVLVLFILDFWRC